MNVVCEDAEKLLALRCYALLHAAIKMHPVLWFWHGAHTSIRYGVRENSFFSWAYGLLVNTYAPESVGKRSESCS